MTEVYRLRPNIALILPKDFAVAAWDILQQRDGYEQVFSGTTFACVGSPITLKNDRPRTNIVPVLRFADPTSHQSRAAVSDPFSQEPEPRDRNRHGSPQPWIRGSY